MECRWQKNGVLDCLHWEDYWKPDNLGLQSPTIDSFWRNTGRWDSAP
jgi:hypothetical protein